MRDFSERHGLTYGLQTALMTDLYRPKMDSFAELNIFPLSKKISKCEPPSVSASLFCISVTLWKVSVQK